MRYNLIGCIALVLWASSLPFAKRCTEELGPLTTVSVQYLVSGTLGVLTLWLTGKFQRASFTFLRHKYFYIRTALFVSYLALLYFAIWTVRREDLPVVTLLNYLWPTITMLLSVVILKQPARVNLLVAGSIVVFAGLALEIVGADVLRLADGSIDMLTGCAFLCAGLAAFAWGFYSVLNRKWGDLAGGTVALPLILISCAGILVMVQILFGEVSPITRDVMLPLAYLSVMPYLANVCWDIGVRKGSITLLSLLADGLPWASLTIASLYLGIAIGSKTWYSAALIIAGALISRVALISASRSVTSLSTKQKV